MHDEAETRRAHIELAVSHLSAAWEDGDEWTYYAEETSSRWRVTEDDLADLGLYLDRGDVDAYSHWCASNGQEEVQEEDMYGPDSALIERLALELPTDIKISDCGIGSDEHGPTLTLPGWTADDGNAEVEYPLAADAEDAAREYVDDGDWDQEEQSGTIWIQVSCWRTVLGYDADGALERWRGDEETISVEVEAPEPDCVSGQEHDWLDHGDVQGHGGGVICRETCAHCGAYRITDTWAQDMTTGEQGLTSVGYEPSDDDSEAWLASGGEVSL